MALSSIRQELLAQLKGQELYVPDLRLMFKHWPMEINHEIEGIRASVPRRILRWAPSPTISHMTQRSLLMRFPVSLSLPKNRSY